MQRFFALSRTTHGVLDIAAPGFVALLWLGKFPPWSTLLLSLFTAFAAYTAIYALNDLVGVMTDKEKVAAGLKHGYSVEASAFRYPLAQGVLDYRSGLIWFAFWFILALIGSYLLNPIIVWILLAAAVLEVIYCLLLKVTYLRTLVSGLVKSSGPIAAIFVVQPKPDWWGVLLTLAWVFFWEIGGQNIPADWNDVEEDRRVGARTVIIRFGPRVAGLIVLISLAITLVLSLFLPHISPLPLGALYLLGTLLIGVVLLLRPAYQLYRSQDGRLAARLFDHASYYPLAQLVLIIPFVLFA